MDDASFQQIITQAGTGDRRALTSLYANYNRMLVRYLRAQVPGYGEDLAQETWLVLASKLRTFRGDERAFRIALLSEARQQAAQFKKTSRRDPTRLMAPRTLNGLRPVTVGDATVADAAVAELLDGLRPQHAEMLLLRVVGGLTAEETGAILGMSPGGVRVTQHRLLRQLARRLGNDRVAQ